MLGSQILEADRSGAYDAVAELLGEPGQIEPHLEVAKVLGGEVVAFLPLAFVALVALANGLLGGRLRKGG